MSNYSGEISAAQVEALKAAGVAAVMVRVDTVDATRIATMQQQLSGLRAGGLPVGGYLFPDYGRDPVSTVATAEERAGPLRWLWVDLERVGPGALPSYPVFRAWVEGAQSACPPGTLLGVYTGPWVIHEMPDWQPVPWPLWAAIYGDRPASLDVTFGGWTKAVGIQYAADVVIGGLTCDLSVFDNIALGLT